MYSNILTIKKLTNYLFLSTILFVFSNDLYPQSTGRYSSRKVVIDGFIKKQNEEGIKNVKIYDEEHKYVSASTSKKGYFRFLCPLSYVRNRGRFVVYYKNIQPFTFTYPGRKTIELRLINNKWIKVPSLIDQIRKESFWEWRMRISKRDTDKNKKKREFKALQNLRYNRGLSELEILEYKARLGYLYVIGYGTKKDINKGVKLVRSAVNNSSEIIESAYALMGDIYHMLEYKAKNRYERSLIWYKRAANQGDIYSMMQVAHVISCHTNQYNKAQKVTQWLRKANLHHITDYCLHKTKHWCHINDNFFADYSELQRVDSVRLKLEHITGKMIFVEGGKYKIEKAKDSISVKSFFIGKYEVTIPQFMEFVKQTKRRKKPKIPSHWLKKDENHYPIIGVTKCDALDFCKWLSHLTGKRFRLPFENEWEFAALGGNKSVNRFKYAGSDSLELVAWYKKNTIQSRKTKRYNAQPVGKKKPNLLGIYDMCGNISELCYIWHSLTNNDKVNSYLNLPSSKKDFVTKGGSWMSPKSECNPKVSIIERNLSKRNYYIGFRVVMEVEVD